MNDGWNPAPAAFIVPPFPWYFFFSTLLLIFLVPVFYPRPMLNVLLFSLIVAALLIVGVVDLVLCWKKMSVLSSYRFWYDNPYMPDMMGVFVVALPVSGLAVLFRSFGAKTRDY